MVQLTETLQRHLGDDFVIERELGGGGMSRVFVAFDRRLDRRVVVKLLRPELGAGVNAQRFRREILTAAALQHPLIVPVLDTGELDGVPYFLMPFVEGESLRSRLQRGTLTVVETVRILRDVARALAVAHARKVVHRDIKPDNVLLANDAAVVADFGVSKAFAIARHEHDARMIGSNHSGSTTTAGVSLGTPAYMAPEQVAADPQASFPMDIYAVGVLAYEMLIGTPPFTGRSPQQVMAAHITELPVPIEERRADLPPALSALVMQCLEKDPAARPENAAALVTALDDPQVMSGSFTPVGEGSGAVEALRALTGGQRSTRGSRRVLWTWAGGAVAVLAVLTAVWWSGFRDGSREAADGASSSGVAAASGGSLMATADTAPSVAVLPFVYLSGDSTQSFTATAIADAITDALARERGLRVSSRSAAESLQRRIAAGDTARMPVQTLVEGVVEVEGNRVRLSVRLVNAADGFTLYADRVEGERGNLFALEDDVANGMRDLLRAHFRLPAADSIGR
ncbi:MAG TPA: serine/threonine-protein kinase [Gemmatimonas sp.]|uniref:serine/threonine-protein kinase n=1 Tax=Gemmatimonas sp. TaxID=1962908 RepID=UPI002EDA760C